MILGAAQLGSRLAITGSLGVLIVAEPYAIVWIGAQGWIVDVPAQPWIVEITS